MLRYRRRAAHRPAVAAPRSRTEARWLTARGLLVGPCELPRGWARSNRSHLGTGTGTPSVTRRFDPADTVVDGLARAARRAGSRPSPAGPAFGVACRGLSAFIGSSWWVRSVAAPTRTARRLVEKVMTPLALNVLDPTMLLGAAGSVAVLVVLFCETGLLLGCFLPGDYLLFTAGVLCATGSRTVHLSLPVTLLCAALGAVARAHVGYLIGGHDGRSLLRRRGNARLQRPTDRAQRFLNRYGIGRALVLPRFVPLVRTVINPLAGIAGVPLPMFTLWRVVGGLVWTAGGPARRLRAGLVGPQRRPLPAADRRRGHRCQPHSGRPGAAALPPHRVRPVNRPCRAVAGRTCLASVQSRSEHAPPGGHVAAVHLEGACLV